MIRRVAIRALPRPDAAEYAWDPDSVCVILGDDAALSTALSRRLAARGWRVAAHPPSAVVDGSLDALLAGPGRVGAVISIAPLASDTSAKPAGQALLGDAAEEAWLLSQFRLARQLSPHLNAAGAPRTWFVAVTRLDGKLGLAPAPDTTGVLTAGVLGLVKTLRLEWPAVFCRAIDLDPALDAAFAAQRIVEELHDPDQTLGEVGHGPDGRSTLGVFEDVHA